MNNLKWSTERPTQEGWYWYKETEETEPDERFNPPRVVRVRKLSDGTLGVIFAIGPHRLDAYAGALWAGPIPEPKEAHNAPQTE